jgi:hypothetical protein
MKKRISSRRVKSGVVSGVSTPSSSSAGEVVSGGGGVDGGLIRDLAEALLVVDRCDREMESLQSGKDALLEEFESRLKDLDELRQAQEVRKAKAVGMANGIYRGSKWWNAGRDFYDTVPGLREAIGVIHLEEMQDRQED